MKAGSWPPARCSSRRKPCTNNLSSVFHYRALHVLDHLGFAALLLSLAFVAARMTFANERRLLAIESELETARRIQASILPAAVPKLDNARVVCRLPAHGGRGRRLL